jgi:hypothetical protein
MAAALAVALAAVLAAAPGAAQQIVEQPVYVAPTQSRIETTPLPPIGGDTEDGGAQTLPQPRFLRAPAATDGTGDGTGGGTGDATGNAGEGAAGDTGRQDGGWERSPDGRFHRAPEREAPAPRADPSAPVVPIDPPATEVRAGAQLRELDKMTGETKTFELAVGETREVDRLRIQLEACRSPEGNDTHGTMAFLKVWDTRYSQDEAAFSGWMFAESPAISALDHPRYDLWVISCTTSAPETSAARR